MFADAAGIPIRLHGGRLEGNTSDHPGVVGDIELLANSELNRGLVVVGEISGSGDLLLTGPKLTRDNTYTGITRVRQGTATVTAARALGDPAATTRVETGETLEVRAVVAEPLELRGGTLEFFPESATYVQPIDSRGGTIRTIGPSWPTKPGRHWLTNLGTSKWWSRDPGTHYGRRTTTHVTRYE